MLKNAFNTINLYNKALDASWLKNEAITNNIANANTPNYKRETVEFEEVLKRAMGNPAISMTKTNEKHMPLMNNMNPVVIKDKSTSFRKDGNNVNIDTEMAYLAENQIKYETLTKQLNSNLKRLRIVME
ncbi:MAG: flagellar basal body rod protein FlgB [Clostridiales bacterium]|nr:flagellar basal body rod protein FlgB [Clostridiales bacterium]